MTIKIISLNLWWGGHLMEAALEFLRTQAADIVMLQEVYNGRDPALADNYRSMEILAERLDYPKARFAQGYLQKNNDQLIPHGNATLSKLPIISDAAMLLTEPTREFYMDIPEHWPILPAPLQHVEADVHGQTVNFYNLHGVWDLKGGDYSEKRKVMTEAILREIDGKPNVVLAGDSNATPDNPGRYLLEKNLKSVFNPEPKTTFNMRHKDNPGYATAAVDLMYVSPNLRVVSAECPDVDVSDHLPLVVELEIPDS